MTDARTEAEAALIIPHKDGFIALDETQAGAIGFYSTREAASEALNLYAQMLNAPDPFAWIELADQLEKIEALPYPSDFFGDDEGPRCDDCSCGRTD